MPNLMSELIDAIRNNRTMGELSNPTQAMIACTLIGAAIGTLAVLILVVLVGWLT